MPIAKPETTQPVLKIGDVARKAEMRDALARLASGCETGAALGSCPFLDELGPRGLPWHVQEC